MGRLDPLMAYEVVIESIRCFIISNMKVGMAAHLSFPFIVPGFVFVSLAFKLSFSDLFRILLVFIFIFFPGSFLTLNFTSSAVCVVALCILFFHFFEARFILFSVFLTCFACFLV